ncbi:7728_t:CDS:2 [Ambispora leptoticha]|uniref:7728_t:CDS:1 n=1 Tax=Ambispora leptoticha TaxID=144679 RepID=A0A9N8YZ76_9GLOM|nr:7728_t:CDS:2 [Ambispora leptoticha]
MPMLTMEVDENFLQFIIVVKTEYSCTKEINILSDTVAYFNNASRGSSSNVMFNYDESNSDILDHHVMRYCT